MENMGPNQIKILYTALFFVYTFVLSIGMIIIWPTLIDLGQIYNADIEKVDRLPMFCQIGFTLGSLSGFLYKSIDQQLYLSFVGALYALTIFFVPFYPNLDCLKVAILVGYSAPASWICSMNLWMINMWPKKKGPIMNALSLTSCIGTVIGAALIAPFVFGTQQIKPEIRKLRLAIPFSITALTLAICPMMFLILHGIKPLESDVDLNLDDKLEQQQQQQPLPVNRSWRKTKLFFVVMSYAFYGNAEGAYANYSTGWLQNFENFTASQAADAMSCLNGAQVLGKIVIIFISLKVSPDTILTCHFFLLISMLILQKMVGEKVGHIVIYVFIVLRGYGFSVMCSTFFIFASNTLKLTNRIMPFFFVFSCLLNIPTTILISYYLETDSAILFKVMSAYFTISIVFFTCTKLLINITDSKSQGNQDKNNNAICLSMKQIRF